MEGGHAHAITPCALSRSAWDPFQPPALPLARPAPKKRAAGRLRPGGGGRQLKRFPPPIPARCGKGCLGGSRRPDQVFGCVVSGEGLLVAPSERGTDATSSLAGAEHGWAPVSILVPVGSRFLGSPGKPLQGAGGPASRVLKRLPSSTPHWQGRLAEATPPARPGERSHSVCVCLKVGGGSNCGDVMTSPQLLPE